MKWLENYQKLSSYITDSSGILLAVDYAKAFDTVRWSLIDKVLELFGFGEVITSAVKTLFADFKTCIYTTRAFLQAFSHRHEAYSRDVVVH